MDLENYLPVLEEETGEILKASEFSPGVYCIDALREGDFLREYFVVLDGAPMAKKVQSYGKKMDGFRLFANEDDSSGWRIVQYEISKYNIAVKGKPVPEHMFRDMSLHAMELHPEYFGAFPIPFHTPHGYTLRHRTLANGIYWLETSEGKELLAVCFPIWNAELSVAATLLCEILEQDRRTGAEASTCYIFFSKEASCIPIYELMETRSEWDGTIISHPALMNAIWAFMPTYAMHLNGKRIPSSRLRFPVSCKDPVWKLFPNLTRSAWFICSPMRGRISCCCNSVQRRPGRNVRALSAAKCWKNLFRGRALTETVNGGMVGVKGGNAVNPKFFHLPRSGRI